MKGMTNRACFDRDDQETMLRQPETFPMLPTRLVRDRRLLRLILPSHRARTSFFLFEQAKRFIGRRLQLVRRPSPAYTLLVESTLEATMRLQSARPAQTGLQR